MKIHIVKKGDSLYLISQKYNVSLEEILKLNPGITNPDMIDVGMKLKIPSGHSGAGGGMDIMHQHVVKQGDTLWKLSKAWGVPLADMIKSNPQLKNPNVLLTGEVVNIPKVGGIMPDTTSTTHKGGAHPLHPSSIMQGVQGLVGKLSTGPITGKAPTAPIAGKTPTAPIAPAPVVPVAPVAPVQEKKPTAPVAKQTAPIVKPVAPSPVPAPPKVVVEPAAKKPLPIEKPVEKKVLPIHSEYKPSVDLFKQYGVPAVEATIMPNMPNLPPAISPTQQQPAYGGYGYPMTQPAQAGQGYGGWQQPTPFNNQVSPFSEGMGNPYDCPPGTVFMNNYSSPSTMPIGSNPDWGYGTPMEGPMLQGLGENSNLSVAGASAFPNQPNPGMVAPFANQPNPGMVAPFANQPNQGMLSQANVQPDYSYSYGYDQSNLSPENISPEYGYGNQQGFVSQANVEQNAGYGYGYPNSYPPYPPYPMWPQTASAGSNPNKSDCGCKGNRSEQNSAKLADAEAPKAVKAAAPKKNGKKAVIRTVAARPSKPSTQKNRPWINR